MEILCVFFSISYEYPERFNVTKKEGDFHLECEINGKKVRKTELLSSRLEQKKGR